MEVATLSFIESLEKWTKAIREDDFTTARRQAESLIMAGELLVVHPDFRRCFSLHCGGIDPHDALVHTCQMLACATDGRARVKQRFTRDKKPGH